MVLNINAKKVVFFYDGPDDIVRLFAEILESKDKMYSIINDNKSIQIGWTYYVFKKIEDYFQIYAADYEKNPFKDLTEDLTLSLGIMKEQLVMTKKIGITSDEVITFKDTLLAKKSALSSNNLYFEKQYKKEKNDSGWYMGNLDDVEKSNNPKDYEIIPLYQLLTICPKAISILNLPLGTIAIIKNNEITGICDSDNKEIYSNK